MVVSPWLQEASDGIVLCVLCLKKRADQMRVFLHFS